jgi:hypothetical protein
VWLNSHPVFLQLTLARLGEQVIEADVFVAGSSSSAKSGCVLAMDNLCARIAHHPVSFGNQSTCGAV